MTENVMGQAQGIAASVHTTSGARSRLKRRYRGEAIFKGLGIAALCLAISFLVLILSSIVWKGLPAFTYNFLSLPLDVSSLDRSALAKADYDGVLKAAVQSQFPEVTARNDRRLLNGLISSGAPVLLRDQALARPDALDRPGAFSLPISDTADLYLKGQVTSSQWANIAESASATAAGAAVTLTFPSDALATSFSTLAGGADATAGKELKATDPSVLIYGPGLVLKVETLAPRSATGTLLIGNPATLPAQLSDLRIRTLQVPEGSRQFTDKEIVWTDVLVERGFVSSGFNWIFATRGASREAEMAGILGAVLGSFLTLVVTLALAFPLGVGAAIYLQEFAVKNRWTTFIEVNINNLAAVPSIVFGLLGLAVFLNFFGLDRSAPYVGGIVLALMTLPTIIIAARVALRSVPPSIREAALGVGASKLQTVIDHVLPLAMPGILTGAIIGMARALGETAPLLMIGMVAFVVDLPTSFASPATVLPVQIYMWADFPEAAFEQRTSAGILVLLVFLVVMNLTAIILRRRFERRW